MPGWELLGVEAPHPVQGREELHLVGADEVVSPAVPVVAQGPLDLAGELEDRPAGEGSMRLILSM